MRLDSRQQLQFMDYPSSGPPWPMPNGTRPENDLGTRIFIRQLVEMHAANLRLESQNMRVPRGRCVLGARETLVDFDRPSRTTGETFHELCKKWDPPRNRLARSPRFTGRARRRLPRERPAELGGATVELRVLLPGRHQRITGPVPAVPGRPDRGVAGTARKRGRRLPRAAFLCKAGARHVLRPARIKASGPG